MLTVLTSGKAAPGATVAAWALTVAWPRPVLVIDGDPAGGDMAAGMLPGRVSHDQGLMTWVAATRSGGAANRSAEVLPRFAVAFEEAKHAWLVPGFATATQALAMTDDAWRRLADALEYAVPLWGRDVIVDAGRASTGTGWPLIQRADRVVVCVRPTVRSVRGALDCVERVRHERGDTVGVGALVVGSGSYSAAEISAALEVPVFAEFPEDRRAAAAFSDGVSLSARGLARTGLVRAASQLAQGLCAQMSAIGVRA